MPHESFGQRLKRLRQNRGLKQGPFASAAHVRQSLVSMIEDGHRDGTRVQAITLWRMAQQLEVTMEYLLTGSAPTRTQTRSAPPSLPDERPDAHNP